MIVYHLLTSKEWEEACRVGRRAPASLEAEGFVHLSFREQVLGTAGRFFREAPDLLAVAFWAEDFGEAYVVEDTMGHGAYPHVYGALEVVLARGVVRLIKGEDGWVWPSGG